MGDLSQTQHKSDAVDGSKLNIEAARRAMASVPNPGQNRFGGQNESFAQAGGQTAPAARNLNVVQPGAHPWINMGRGDSPHTSPGLGGSGGKKKIVVPPEGAWGDSQPRALPRRT
eukprot:TRINITY_DN582_c0_g1_i1.p1 TRINITY_DN582_c0_g1~~TRINITY_DN582_c0_g1_i1.p1  ORF type:complete len:115 (-),score=19.58 TRINITY_DN582_c0_g1_i1:162-506(-)